MADVVTRVLAEARQVDPAFADYVTAVFERPLRFEGEWPIVHSGANHVHLWMPEYLGDRHAAIDLAFRTRLVEAIFARWTARARSDHRCARDGFRLYLYEDLAPTVSIVAETPQGCPYGGDLTFVPRIEDVLARYDGRSWRARFTSDGPSPEQVLAAVEAEDGSIGTRAARRLGCAVGELRRLIEACDLGDAVNALRKRSRRRPAAFRDEVPVRARMYERRVPPR